MLTKPLVAVEEVRSLLPVRQGDPTHDERIMRSIIVATEMIQSHTRRFFTSQTFEEYKGTVDTVRYSYDWASTGNESGVLSSSRAVRYVLLGFPIARDVAITVNYDPTRVYGATTLLPATDFYLDAGRSVLFVKTAMREYLEALKITYVGGYAVDTDTDSLTTTAPEDLKMACIVQAVYLFNRFTAENIGMEREQSSSNGRLVRILTRNSLTPEAAGLIARYRQPALGMI